MRRLKPVRYSSAADRVSASFRMVREELVVFSSAFDSMWWDDVTMTPVGSADTYPVTAGGKVFTALDLFVAPGMIAMPTGRVSAALARVGYEEKLGNSERPDLTAACPQTVRASRQSLDAHAAAKFTSVQTAICSEALK